MTCKTILTRLFIIAGLVGQFYWLTLLTVNESLDQIEQVTTAQGRIKIFYTLFVGSVDDIPRVQRLVQDQLNMIDARYHGEILITSIGVPMDVPNTTTQLYTQQGSENLALKALWDYCKDHSESKVIYLHSKGSFHNRPVQERFREFLTRGALSNECATLPSTCNVCSSRMSPLPHPHTPGNMFLARCSYVNQLSEPEQFEQAMDNFKTAPNRGPCVGKGRFAAEHWVHSHPDVKPCDLYRQPSYAWGYKGLPDLSTFEKNMELQMAPRFPLHVYYNFSRNVCIKPLLGTKARLLNEYKAVYSSNPPDDWWGWSTFHDLNSTYPY